MSNHIHQLNHAAAARVCEILGRPDESRELQSVDDFDPWDIFPSLYGISPRHCFPTSEFKALLPELIERWRAWSNRQWEG